jgi:hypothetical protein
MLQEMRQPRPSQWHIMAACRYAQNGGATFQTRRMLQGNLQAIGQGQLKGMRVGRRRHGHFRNVECAHVSKPTGSGLVQRPVQLGATVLQVVIGGAGVEDRLAIQLPDGMSIEL